MRVALVDLLFRWPPDCGAYLDLFQNAARLAADHEVRLFVFAIDALSRHAPRARLLLDRTKFFDRGRVDRPLPFAVTTLPVSAAEYRPARVVALARRALDGFRPDRVMVANGWQMKPHLALGLRDYAPLLRLYAYEGQCLRAGLPCRHGRPCHVDYLDGTRAALLTCLGCALRFHAGYPSPAYLHELAASGALRPGYREVVRRGLAAARTVVVYSAAQAARLRRLALPVTIVRHGVDRRQFAAAPPPPPRPFRFLAPGRIEQHEKGGAVLLAASRLLYRRRPDFELWLTTPRRYREPFVRPCGFVRHERLADLYAQVHAVVVPSIWPEPFGIVAVEGLMAGRPVIASAVGGLQEIVVPEECGALVPPGDAAALARAMEALLDDPARCRALGEAARARAEAEYDLDEVHRRYVRPLFA